MKKLIILTILLFGAMAVNAQTTECPVDKVCISPEAARKALGMSLTAFAKALRLGKTGRDTVRAWENDSNIRGVPGPVQIAVACLLQHKER